MFKFNQIVLAVAATLAAGHVLAVPVTPVDITLARQANNLQEAWITGASAPTYNVFQGFAAGCVSDTLSFFHDQALTGAVRPGSAKDDLAYACVRQGSSQVAVLYHTIAGGSFNAFAPHTDGVKLTRLKNLSSQSQNGCVKITDTIKVNDDQEHVAIYRSCAKGTGATLNDGAPALPAGGFSDVEAQLFGVDVSEVGEQAPANVGQVFGVAVSKSLYRALQTAQKITKNTDALDPNYDPVNAPNLSSAQYAALITGSYINWSNLIPNNTTTPVRIGRRVNTSGTQASSNAHFLKNPCNGDPVIGGALPPQTTVSAQALGEATYLVTEDSSTSTLKGRFVEAAGTTSYVIGLMSLENNWRNTDPTKVEHYRFIKVDNVHPEAPEVGSTETYDAKARYTAANGDYALHMEMVSFKAKSALGTFGADVIDEIVGAFGTLACGDVPRGLTLNPGAGSACEAGKEVAKVSRGGNNCQAPVMAF